jgi:hypothetical protein
MLDPSRYISEPVADDVLCKNCRHAFKEHNPDGFACNAEDEESGSICACTFYEEWDSQPVEVYIPSSATLEDLIALRRAACADGRMVPAGLSERIQAMRDRETARPEIADDKPR